MNTFRTSIISLVAGIVFGFLIHHPAYPIPPDPGVTPLDALCSEIDYQERLQRDIFDDHNALPLPECHTAQPSTKADVKEGEAPRGNESIAERVRHYLASFFRQPKVTSPDQPKSIASTP
jgi:hypothetical protein